MAINLHVWKRTGCRLNIYLRRLREEDDPGKEISQICKPERHRRGLKHRSQHRFPVCVLARSLVNAVDFNIRHHRQIYRNAPLLQIIMQPKLVARLCINRHPQSMFRQGDLKRFLLKRYAVFQASPPREKPIPQANCFRRTIRESLRNGIQSIPNPAFPLRHEPL